MSETSYSDRYTEDMDDAVIEKSSLLDELKAEAAKTVTESREPLLIRVNGRENWAVEYSGDLSLQELKHISRRCQIKTGAKEKEIDDLKFAALVLGAVETRIFKVEPISGKVLDEMTTKNGDPMSLDHLEFIKLFQGDDDSGRVDMVKSTARFLGDVGTSTHANEVLAWLGLNDEAERLNPFKG